jgi:hypothetical protein
MVTNGRIDPSGRSEETRNSLAASIARSSSEVQMLMRPLNAVPGAGGSLSREC